MKPSLVDKRHCVRCGAEVHMSAEYQPHLCKDIAKRLKKRERQVEAVIAILYDPQGVRGLNMREKAEAIVTKLANLGVEED